MSREIESLQRQINVLRGELYVARDLLFQLAYATGYEVIDGRSARASYTSTGIAVYPVGLVLQKREDPEEESL